MYKMQRDVAWLAGIFDGEGSASLSRHESATGRFYYNAWAFAVTNTDMAIIQRVENILKRLGIRHKRFPHKRSAVPWRRLAYNVRISDASNIQRYLKTILLYTTGDKRKRSEIVLSFLAIPRPKSFGKGHRPDWLSDLYAQLYNKMPRRGSKERFRALSKGA